MGTLRNRIDKQNREIGGRIGRVYTDLVEGFLCRF